MGMIRCVSLASMLCCVFFCLRLDMSMVDGSLVNWLMLEVTNKPLNMASRPVDNGYDPLRMHDTIYMCASLQFICVDVLGSHPLGCAVGVFPMPTAQ